MAKSHEAKDDFIDNPNHWSPAVAQTWAKQEGLGILTDRHWQVIDYLREHYMTNRTIPVMRHVCHELGFENGCIGRLFGNPEIAWKLAGLPDPGEEAKAYMETAETPH